MAGWRGAAKWGLALTVSAAACSDTPLAPEASRTYDKNAPLIIRAITAPVTRAEVEQEVPIVADIGNAALPLDQLTFEWSANVGIITGHGPNVVWRLKKGTTAVPKTPVNLTVTLKVTERYRAADEHGEQVTHSFWAVRLATLLRVDDSVAELTKMGLDFLVTYFGNSSVAPIDCLVDFWFHCQGRCDEYSDIVANRMNFLILSAQAQVSTIEFDASRTSATVTAPCRFHDRDLRTGEEGTSAGDCVLTGVYRENRWWLCDSHFLHGTRTMTMYEFFMMGFGRVPEDNTKTPVVPCDPTTLPASGSRRR